MHNEGQLLTAEFGVGKGRILGAFCNHGILQKQNATNPRNCRIGVGSPLHAPQPASTHPAQVEKEKQKRG
jgi:hypothetical protein